MRDKLLCIWSFREWELEQQQTWLSDMAERGWHLQPPSAVLATFRRGNAEKMRYRCELTTGEGAERIALYQAAGWEYVCRRGHLLVFRAPVEGAVPEISLDIPRQTATLRLIGRNLWLNLGTALLWPAVTAALFLFSPHLLLTFGWTEMLLLLLVAVLCGQTVQGLMQVTGMIRSLTQGDTLQRSLPYPPLLRRRRLAAPLLLLLALLLGASVIQGNLSRRSASFPAIGDQLLPLPRLEQLLQLAGYQEYHPSQMGTHVKERAGFDVFNYYHTKSSLLFPVQQELSECMEVPGKLLSDGRTSYSPILITRRYVARTPGLARLLAKQLARGEGQQLFRIPSLQPASLPGLDGYWQRQEKGASAFVMLSGNVVLDVYYSGLEPFEQLLQLQLSRLRP